MKLAIWDFDGTLAHRVGLWTSALMQVLDEHAPGHGVRSDQFGDILRSRFPWHSPSEGHPHLCKADAWWGHVTPIFSAAYRAAGIEEDQAHKLASRVRGVFCDPAGWSLFADTIPALRALQELGWTHVVLSNHVPELPHISSALGLDAHLSAIYNSAVIGFEKPHPEAFRAVLRDFPSTSAVWMIGDNPDADIRGAREVGIPGILVRRFTEGVTPFAESLGDVLTIMEGTAGGTSPGEL